jgi:hypothetical protein
MVGRADCTWSLPLVSELRLSYSQHLYQIGHYKCISYSLYVLVAQFIKDSLCFGTQSFITNTTLSPSCYVSHKAEMLRYSWQCAWRLCVSDFERHQIPAKHLEPIIQWCSIIRIYFLKVRIASALHSNCIIIYNILNRMTASSVSASSVSALSSIMSSSVPL